MLFIDQPVGTGFSWTDSPDDEVTSEVQVAEDVLQFLLAFLAAKPALAGNDFFVTGESYAGHYCPAVAARVAEHNAAEAAAEAAERGLVSQGPAINLKGVAIGNGLTEPATQYGAYAKFAADNGLIGDATRRGIDRIFPWCKFGIDLCQVRQTDRERGREREREAHTLPPIIALHPPTSHLFPSLSSLPHSLSLSLSLSLVQTKHKNPLGFDWVCSLALSFCGAVVYGPIMAEGGGFNVYDISKKCEGPLCYPEFEVMDRYLAQPEVLAALNVKPGLVWQSCSREVYADMLGDFMRSYADRVTPLVDGGAARFLIYVGTRDFICNWYGNERWVDALPWAGRYDFEDSDFVDWGVVGDGGGGGADAPKPAPGRVRAGTVKGDGLALTFALVEAAGHMVPMDQPAAALAMITAFTRGRNISAGWEAGVRGGQARLGVA